MSMNDPQWGNSHRPEQKNPEPVPDSTGTDSAQPEHRTDDLETDVADTATSTPPPAVGKTSSPPPEGPPDLEVLWQQWVHGMRCKLAMILRRPPPSLPTPLLANAHHQPSSENVPLGWQALTWKNWLYGASFLLAAWLMSGFYLVDANQRGVLTRLGRMVRVENPGWHWRWPYPLESVRLINVTNERALEISATANPTLPGGEGLFLTADQKLVQVGYTVVYQVQDPLAYVSRVEDPAEVLGWVTSSAVRQAVAAQSLSLLQAAVGKSEPNREELPVLESVRETIQRTMDALGVGIKVNAVQLTALRLPALVLQATKKAEQIEQSQIRSLREAQTDAGESLIRARQLANQLQSETRAYREALALATARINAQVDQPDRTQTEQQLAGMIQNWRNQYPLVFVNYQALLEQSKETSATKKFISGHAGEASKVQQEERGVVSQASLSELGRDRELTRSRDRIDRLGNPQ